MYKILLIFTLQFLQIFTLFIICIINCNIPAAIYFVFYRKSSVDVMSRAMIIAATSDLHWEVRVNALYFWDNFIKSHLTDQGMLDGSFPNVTFSKEHRKIVQLNETEIKRRINKALDDLSKQNCLGVSQYVNKLINKFQHLKRILNSRVILRNFLFLNQYSRN